MWDAEWEAVAGGGSDMEVRSGRRGRSGKAGEMSEASWGAGV